MRIKQKRIIAIGLLILVLGLSACNDNHPQNDDEIDTAFEQDYVLIDYVTEYLLSLKEPWVDIDCKRITIRHVGVSGKDMEFQSFGIEPVIAELADRGYKHIEKKDNVVIFDIWRKSFHSEFESGFVYSIDDTDNLSSIEYLTYQRSLPKEKWYYYEADYNEWRTHQRTN